MTAEDRELLPLAEGSAWVNAPRTLSITNTFGDTIHLDCGWLWKNDDADAVAKEQDLIALLHRAGLLDGLLRKAWDESINHAVCELADNGLHESAVIVGRLRSDNPHRKADTDGD